MEHDKKSRQVAKKKPNKQKWYKNCEKIESK